MRHKINKCKDCNKEIYRTSIRCNSCSNKNRKGKYKWNDLAKTKRREKGNPNWKANSINKNTGHIRARRKFHQKENCNFCGKAKAERHHQDGNPMNNNKDNIIWLCRSCHMKEDGRILNIGKRRHYEQMRTLQRKTCGRDVERL